MDLVERTQQDRFEVSESAATSYTRDIKKSVSIGGLLGAAAGLALGLAAGATATVLAPLVVAGATAGALLKYVTGSRGNSGQVNIILNGETRQTHYKCDPDAFCYSPEETRVILTCEGKIGDDFRPSQSSGVDLKDSNLLNSMRPYRAKFKELGSQRRLAADFGGKTRYGHDSLDVVDAKTAAKVLASGQEIYVVNGNKSEILQHRLESQSQSQNKKTAFNQSYNVTERRFEYNLQQINDPEQLKSVQAAQGTPSSMIALYKESSVTNQIVKGSSCASEADSRGESITRRLSAAAKGSKNNGPREGVEKARVSLVRKDTNGAVALGFVGYIGGAALATGFGLPAVLGIGPAIALGAVGYNYMDKIIRQEQGRAVEG